MEWLLIFVWGHNFGYAATNMMVTERFGTRAECEVAAEKIREVTNEARYGEQFNTHRCFEVQPLRGAK